MAPGAFPVGSEQALSWRSGRPITRGGVGCRPRADRSMADSRTALSARSANRTSCRYQSVAKRLPGPCSWPRDDPSTIGAWLIGIGGNDCAPTSSGWTAEGSGMSVAGTLAGLGGRVLPGSVYPPWTRGLQPLRSRTPPVHRYCDQDRSSRLELRTGDRVPHSDQPASTQFGRDGVAGPPGQSGR